MKKVLSLWKVIVIIISALVGVAGGTALTLYLLGDLDEEFVEPQDIYFEKTLSEGDGFYNAELSCYEVASDTFKMLISSSTEGVTETKVTLSLLGQGNVVDGYISDGIIKVPQVVDINKAFTVTLEQTFDNTLDKYLIMGGKSVLTAKSSNVLLTPQTVNISVDCPVDSINVNVVTDFENENTNELLQTVVVDEQFSLDVDFLPVNSENIFFDSTRRKEVFYNFTKAYISYNWETGKWTANTKSGNNFDTITAYTFKNSFYQQQILQTYSYITNREELTSAILRYFEENPQTCVSKSINIKVDSVGVSRFEMKDGNKTFENLSFDKYFTITANSATADATLGLIIEDAHNKSMTSLFTNVGLRIPAESEDFESLTYEGGKFVKVEFLTGVVAPKITKLDNLDGISDLTANAEGVEKTYYYLLPNTSPKFASDYYWKFSVVSGTGEDEEFTLEANFFYENAEGELVAFREFDQTKENAEQKVVLKASSTAQGIEENIGWDPEKQAGIALTINFNDKGVALYDDVDLEDYIGVIPATNLYQTIKYFLVLPAELEADTNFNIHDYFVCEEGKEYSVDHQGTKLKISNVEMNNEVYTLYELQGSVLTAKKSFSGTVYVVAATVKSKADGSLYDDDGKYVVVKMTTGKEVTVASSLSIANMTPSFKITDEEGRVYEDVATGKIYIPAIAKNNSGSDLDLLKFNLSLANCETFDTDYNSNSDVSKVLKAFADKSLRLESVSGIVVADYVSLENLQLAENGADETNKIATFEGILKINKSLINSSVVKDTEGTEIALRLIYDDGTNTYSKDVLSADGKTSFNVYYQQVCEIEGTFENDNSKKDGEGFYPITVDVTTDGTTIKWGNEYVEAITLEDLNSALTFEMLDQFEKTVKPTDGVYKVKFEETTDKNILSFNADFTKIQNFNTTNGQVITTTLNVYVVSVDSSGNETKVGKFDENGNLIYGADGELEALSSPTLTFNITSESIKEVWYDNQKADTNQPATTDSAIWVKSNSISTVKIQRYITANDAFVLADAVRMYADAVEGATVEEKVEFIKNDTTEFYQNTEFYFDTDFLTSLSAERGEMLRKMFKEINLADGVDAPVDDTNLKNYQGYQIKNVVFAFPFANQNIKLVFKATGKDGALFDATIELECLPDLTINTSAFNEYETKYADYLVSEQASGNKIRIFAGQTFDLDAYAMLSSYTGRAGATEAYSWTTLIDSIGGADKCTVVDPAGIAEIKIVNSKYALVVNDVYDYTNLIVSLYYGYKSDYACSITLQFYVQPNMVVRQMGGYDENTNGVIDANETYQFTETGTNLDVALIASKPQLENYYTIYRLISDDTRGYVGYVDQAGVAKGFEDANKIDISDYLKYTNETTTFGKYIQIKDGKIVYSDGANTIDFNQGQTYSQSLYVTYENGSVRVDRLKAIRIIEGETTQVVVNEAGVRLEFALGLGTDMGNLLTYELDADGDGTNEEYSVKTVTYNGQEYVLLAPNTTYNLATGYNVDQVAGMIRKSGLKAIATGGLTTGYANYEGNTFVLSQTFATDSDSLTATILLKAFVTALGEKFVYYNNGAFDLDDMEFNYFEYEVKDAQGNVTGTVDVDLNSLLQLKDANVYQNVVAGQTYTVVHNSDDALADGTQLKDAIGFYFSEKIAKAYSGELSTGRVSVSIFKDDLKIASLTKANVADNYETLLTFKSLDKAFADDYGDIFVTLKFEIYKIANPSDNFVWYYNIKVNPDYTLDQPTYPYADDAEYLSETHIDFDGEKYVVDLEETFTASNSKFTSGTRFAIPYLIEDGSEVENLTSSYSISKIVVKGVENDVVYETEEEILTAIKTYFKTLNISEGVLTAQYETKEMIDVYVSKSYFTNGVEMIASKRNYVFKINQNGSFTHTVKVSIGGGAEQLLSKENDTAIMHNQTLTAGSGEVVYTTTLKADAGNNLYTNVAEFGAYIKALNGASLGEGLKPISKTYDDVAEDFVYSYDGAKYSYSVSTGTKFYTKFGRIYTPIYTYSEEEDLTYSFDNPLDLTHEYAQVSVVVGGNTISAYVKSSDVKEATIYAYMDNDKKLHFAPLAHVARDIKLEIGYYALESAMQTDVISRVVFKIEVDMKSYFNYQLNDSTITENFVISGGNKYYFFNTDKSKSIFSTLENTKPSGTVENINLELLNGEEEYYSAEEEYYVEGVTLADLILFGNEGGLDGTIEFANMPKDATFKFKGIINESEDDEYSFEFEMLVKANVNLQSERLIDVSGGSAHYSNYAFEVESSNLESAYGWDVAAGTGVACFDYSFNGDGDIEYVNKTELNYLTYVDKTVYPTQGLELKYVFNKKTIYKFIVNYKYKVEPSVNVEANCPIPDGKTNLEEEYISTEQVDGVFEGMIEDFFNTKPVFSSENRISILHISKDLADSCVVDGNTITNTDASIKKFIEEIGENWTVSVSSISNLSLTISGSYFDANNGGEQTINKTITENGTIIENALVKNVTAEDGTVTEAYTDPDDEGNIVVSRPDFDFNFVVQNSNTDGVVELAVKINGKTVIYKVVVKVGSAYEVVLNQPNYTNNREIIYAEDLASQELNIFAQDRIASFTTKDNASVGNYFLRLVNKTNTNEIHTPMISITDKSALMNIDLGKSYSNYYYDGTYLSETLAKVGGEENQKDSELYQGEFVLTDRIIVKYAGVEIKFADVGVSDGVQLILKERITTKDATTGNFTYKEAYDETTQTFKYKYADLDRTTANDADANGIKNDILASRYDIYEKFYAQPTTLEVYLDGIEEDLLALNAIYTYFLDIEFMVEGTANSISDYTTYELKANGGLGTSQTPYQLMELVNIYNKRTQKAYGTTGLSKSAGIIDLKIYGFSDLAVSLDSSITIDKEGREYVNSLGTDESGLKAVAGYIHKMLQTTENENGIKYWTGLIPNYKMTTINATGIGSNSYENFISIAGAESGKTLDYKIFAHASNNDGNHVMMRLAYSVDINGGTTDSGVITKYYNLLFKVVPNSTFRFESGHDTRNFIEGANEIIDGQSVVTNYQQVYTINGSANPEITLWTTTTGGVSSIIAQMYGGSSNTANGFTYKITLNNKQGAVTYNDWSGLKGWLDSSSLWTKSDSVYTHAVIENEQGKLTVSDNDTISLGSRDFMIEIENNYGYKARFYYRYISKTNPQIESISSQTVTENTNLAFASKYYYVNPTYTTGSNQTKVDLDPFEYRMVWEDGTTKYFANTIIVEGFNEDIVATVNVGSVKYSTTLNKEEIDLGEGKKVTYYSIWKSDRKWSGVVDGEAEEVPKDEIVDFYTWITASPHITFSIPKQDAGTSTYSIEYVHNFVTSSDGKTYFANTIEGTTQVNGIDSEITLENFIKNKKKVSVALKQSYTVSSTATAPIVNIDDSSTVLITGLNAYAFNTKIDSNSMVDDYFSDINNVKIKSVDFYYDGAWIGGSWATTSYGTAYSDKNPYMSKQNEFDDKVKYKDETGGVHEKEPDPSEVSIITTKDSFFVNGKDGGSLKITTGTSGSKNTETENTETENTEGPYVFKVPFIEGSLYGSGTVLNGVTMKVTLVQDGVDAQITTTMNIARKSYTTGLFETNVRDFEKPQINNSNLENENNGANNNGAKPVILNDTLEVVLPSKASASFIVHDAEIVYTDWSDETKSATLAIDKSGKMIAPKVITLTNPNNYAITEYVGISASIVGLEKNLNNGDHKNFYIQTLNKEGNVVFNYNGSKVTTEGSTSTDLEWISTCDIDFVSGKEEVSINVSAGKVARLGFMKVKKDESDAKLAFTLQDFTNLNFVEYKGDNDSSKTHEIILADMVGELADGDSVYVVELKENNTSALGEIKYDGVETATKLKYAQLSQVKGEIGRYSEEGNALKMNINHVEELNSGYTKTEMLHFMLGANGETYRFVETFTVYPQFTEAREIVTTTKEVTTGEGESATTETVKAYQLDQNGNFLAGDNKFTVKDYMSVTNDLGTYYLIPLSSWSEDIALLNENCGYSLGYGLPEGVSDNKVSASSAGFEKMKNSEYMFYYQINSTLGGSAFIDENGMITTTTNYDLSTHQMSVDVFMKVSGNDGKYQDNNTTIHVGTFIINLDPNASLEQVDLNRGEDGNQGGTGTYVINYKNVVNLGNGGIEGDESVLYATTDLAKHINDNSLVTKIKDAAGCSLSEDAQHSYLVGTTVEFEKLFGTKKEIKGLTNRNYHIVYDNLNAPDSYIYYNNLNSWTFTNAGVHEVDVVVTGYTESMLFKYYIIKKVTFVIYDTSINEEKTFNNEDVEIEITDGNVSHKLNTAFTWYSKEENGNVMEVVGGTYLLNLVSYEYNGEKEYVSASTGDADFTYSEGKNVIIIHLLEGVSAKVWLSGAVIDEQFMKENTPTSITGESEIIFNNGNSLIDGDRVFIRIVVDNFGGIFEKEYLAATNDSIKNVKYKYFIYGAEVEKILALQKYETFNLSKLTEEKTATYKFYDKDTYQELSAISLEYGENTILPKEILMHKVMANGTQSLTLVNLKIKIVSSSATAKTLEASSNVDENELFNLVKQKVSTSITGIADATFKSVADSVDADGNQLTNTWVLEILNNQFLTDASTGVATTDTKFLVTYKNSEGIRKVYRFAFNYYLYNGSHVLVRDVVANNSYELSNLNSSIRTSLGADAGIVVKYFKLVGEKLNEIKVVDAEVSSKDNYLVLVGEDYYKYEIMLCAKSYDIYLEETNSLSVKRAVLASLKTTDMTKEVKYYDNSLQEITSWTGVSSFYALVSGNYYKYQISNITFEETNYLYNVEEGTYFVSEIENAVLANFAEETVIEEWYLMIDAALVQTDETSFLIDEGDIEPLVVLVEGKYYKFITKAIVDFEAEADAYVPYQGEYLVDLIEADVKDGLGIDPSRDVVFYNVENGILIEAEKINILPGETLEVVIISDDNLFYRIWVEVE